MTRPNIIFILIDDMGWKDLGCYGSGFYETPHLDAMAQQGVRFTDAYAASPVCSPARASIMTGKYPSRIPITNYIAGMEKGKMLSTPYLFYLPHKEVTLAKALHEGGYATWHVGKWHLGERDYWPDRHGFEVNVGGCHMGYPPSYFSPYKNPALPDGPPGEYLTDRLTDEAISLIRKRDGRPFFLNLWHYAVHTPIQVRPEWTAKYKAKADVLGLDESKALAVGEHFPCEHKKDQRVRRRLFQSDASYAAMVQNLDWNVGRVLRTLQEEGIAENTIVIFTSDNGGLCTAEGSPTCNKPLAEGKGWMYDGGTRDPLLVRWPGVIPPDTVCRTPVTSPDFYPTLLEAAGLDARPQQHLDGRSLMPLLTGSGGLDRQAIYWHYPHYGNQGGTPGCSIRMGDFKLIRFFEEERLELYDVTHDVGETRDLAAERPDLVARMSKMLSDWLEETGARLPQANPDFVPWDLD